MGYKTRPTVFVNALGNWWRNWGWGGRRWGWPNWHNWHNWPNWEIGGTTGNHSLDGE